MSLRRYFIGLGGKILQAPSEGGPLEAIEALVAKLGRGLERLGELLAPARDAVGRALIDIGYKIHSLLCALPPVPAAPCLPPAHRTSFGLMLASVFPLRGARDYRQSSGSKTLPVTPLECSGPVIHCFCAAQAWQSIAKSACCAMWQAIHSVPCFTCWML